jgi:hypothetical protein
MVRRALDKDLRRARADGRTFLDTDVAALRRQANDLDRLEALVARPDAKPWDYTPKTQAHQQYREAVRALFGTGADELDPFTAAIEQLNASAAAAEAGGGPMGHPEDTGPG